MTHIRLARPSDRETLAAMRATLWPDGDVAEHARELDALLGGTGATVYPYTILVAETPEGDLAGFADVTLRSYAEGCDPSRPVGYLEGWFVREDLRRQRIGAALLQAAEQWSRDQGCIEMGSDTWLDNELSQRAHERLGFEEADRCVHYRKTL
ncbi:MAG TPA: GNAT family N-acetyltransferase [Thermoanaerobaculia bacterium]|nr:GNAT family N-acetyltransferase [Thermoanaerobaculia bacterium]